jgi:hypothetical protein
MMLFRTIRSMMSGFDAVEFRKGNWDEVAVDPRWHCRHTTSVFLTNRASEDRPLYKLLRKTQHGSSRPLVGMNITYDHFMYDGTHRAVNILLAASGESAMVEEVGPFIGKKEFLRRPIAQRTPKWRILSTPRARRIAVWTLAVGCSIWGLEFMMSFLDLCNAALVGPVCAVTRQECKEGFAACVAVATIARARSDCPITSGEIACCHRVLRILEVLELACNTANGTLWSSRTIERLAGTRIPVKASDNWETSIDPALNPSHSFSVVGAERAHGKKSKSNPNGTQGTACAGRWIVVTKLGD